MGVASEKLEIYSVFPDKTLALYQQTALCQDYEGFCDLALLSYSYNYFISLWAQAMLPSHRRVKPLIPAKNKKGVHMVHIVIICVACLWVVTGG